MCILVPSYISHKVATYAVREFGREYSQLSRIENRIKAYLIIRNRHKIVGNLDWFSDRFHMHAVSYDRAIAYSNLNANLL